MGDGLLDAALGYAAIGHPVFPLEPRGKRPLGQVVPHGLTEATTDAAQIRAWWADTPTANIGLRCDTLAVLDIDSPDGVAAVRGLIRTEGRTAHPATSLTGSGTHLVYRAPDGATLRPRARVRPGLDIRAGASYIVAPPSIHPTGHRYRWAAGPTLADTPTMPDRWAHALTPPRNVTPTAAVRCVPPPGHVSRYGYGALTAILNDLRATPQGARNDGYYYAARRVLELHDAGHIPDADEALSLVERVGLNIGLHEHEIRTSMDSARDGHTRKAVAA